MGWHRIVLGIGNPGPEYDATRHNIGFMVLDLVAQRVGLSFTRLERHADDGSKLFGGKVKAQVCEGRRKPCTTAKESALRARQPRCSRAGGRLLLSLGLFHHLLTALPVPYGTNRGACYAFVRVLR